MLLGDLTESPFHVKWRFAKLQVPAHHTTSFPADTMSGPTTVIFTAHPVAVLLAAAAVRAALAVQEGYARAEDLQQSHQDQRDALHQMQGASEATGRQALDEEASTAEAAFVQIQTVAEKLGIAKQVQATRPLRPETADRIAMAAYVRALHALAEQLRTLLLTEAARQSAEFADMPEFSMQAAVGAAVPQQLAQRLLARIAHLGMAPAHLQKIALELDQTPPGERAHLLATELRAQVQAHIDAVQKQQVQEAASVVVLQSLKDLGYQVEEVSDTLFVEGGVLHFRRPGWGNYMVRMRVDAQAESANFNVVRAVAQGENERSVLDHLAEDRWCAEFPALLQALEVRGIHLQVTRRLEAGAVPVQLVDAAKLPKFSEEESSPVRAQPLTKKLP
ncbi:MAG: hypothetical protein A3F78_08070 [Burkholderiales bacterium RIFCSPLOWO2_12_FULL_61_40]|nr:MAG: hypothetical protein A3F78_08070 [Burkholderiales bacterium RIFCSPLOWO2_12_FULL_61_40]